MKTCLICGSAEHPSWKAHVFVNTLGRLVQKAVNTVPKARKENSADRHSDGYMKAYMAARRAVKAGRACPWPR